MSNYDDIINLEYVKSDRHAHMTTLNRAAQFAPFAALTGHEDAINETADAHKPVEIERETFEGSI